MASATAPRREATASVSHERCGLADASGAGTREAGSAAVEESCASTSPFVDIDHALDRRNSFSNDALDAGLQRDTAHAATGASAHHVNPKNPGCWRPIDDMRIAAIELERRPDFVQSCLNGSECLVVVGCGNGRGCGFGFGRHKSTIQGTGQCIRGTALPRGSVRLPYWHQ